MNIYFYDLGLNESFYAQYIINGLKKNGHNVHTRCPIIPGNYDLMIFMGFSFMNHLLSGDDYLLDVIDIPFIVLWYDDPRRYLYSLEFIKKTNYTFICCDSEITKKMKELGFKNTHYLPCTYDPEIQKPGLIENVDHDVSFAGSVFSEETLINRRKGLCRSDIERLKLNIRHRVPGKYYDYVEFIRNFAPYRNESHVMQCALMEQKHCLRLDMFNTLKEYNLHIYGQGDYRPENMGNVICHNRNLHQHTELPVLYARSKISLSIELLPASVHQRIFECVASGGFPLLEKKIDNKKCFDTFIEWDSLDELKDLVAFYLKNEGERNHIKNKMMEEVNKRHTNTIRAREVMDIYEKKR